MKGTRIGGLKLTKVVDGDTIKVNIPGVHHIFGDNIGIRINNIDAPEIRGKCDQEKELALKARERVRELLNGAQVNLKGCSRGKYFRLVCDVNGIDDVLCSEGLAVPYHGGRKSKDWCE